MISPKTNSHFAFCCLFILSSFALKGQNTTDQLNQHFYRYQMLEIDTRSLLHQINNSPANFIEIRLLDREMLLKKSDILSGDYTCMVAGDNETYQATIQPAIPMSGYTRTGERVSLTVGNKFIQGFIQSENSLIYIEPVYHFEKNYAPGWFVVYKTEDIIPGRETSCGVTESDRIHDRDHDQHSENRMNGDCFKVDYAIATDFLMYDHYGSVSAVQNHNIAVTNDMQTNYDDEFADEIQFVIVEQFIVSSPGSDPFTASTSSSDLLTSFSNWAPSGFIQTHDIGTLWTKRDLDGTTIGLAWIGTVCEYNPYNICEDFSTDANLKRVLVAHEIGHNFNAVHDASTGYIMYASVGNYTVWSSQSISDIQNHYLACYCLDDCVGTTPTISFNTASASTSETGETPGSPLCDSYHKIYTIPVKLSILSSLPNTLNVNVLGSGTATEGKDFILNTQTLTFPANSASTQFIELELINDAIEEPTETIELELSMISGAAVIGSIPVFTLNLIDGLDQVSTSCCSPNTTYIAYGSGTSATPFIFTCTYEDGRSRFLYLASQLSAAGITAGYFTGIAFYTALKYSTFPYQNFRIGMSNTSWTTLENQSWIDTDQVFFGSVSTVQSTWVTINFDTPFYWDGTSSLYFEFCFDNTVNTGNPAYLDYIRYTTPVGGGSGKYNNAIVNNNANGCSLDDGDIVLTYNNQSYQPQLRFYKLSGAKIETTVTGSAVSYIKSGEKAHFYSANDKVIASVKNIGPTDLECTTVQLATAGTTKPNLPFGGGQYAAKTFQVNADENSLYEITLYYTPGELSTWGTDAGRLNIIKSSSPLASSTLSGVEIIRPDTVYATFGPDNAYVYKGTFSGFSYFSLTNRIVPAGSVLSVGDLVFLQASKGPLLQNKSGQQYAISVNNTGTIQVANSPGALYSFVIDDDLVVNQSSQGLVLRAPNNGFWKLAVNNSGVITTSSVAPLSANRLENAANHMLLNKGGGSFILKSPDNKCWRIFINETGGLRTVNVLCP